LAIFPLVLGVNFLLISVVTPAQAPRIEVSYTFFKQQVEAGNVVEISTRADTIQGTFKQAVPYPSGAGAAARSAGDFSTVIPSFADPGLELLLSAHGGIINARPIDDPPNPLLTVLLGFGPMLLLIGAFLWLSRRAAGQMGRGLIGLGKSQARRYDQATVGERGVTFADVAGIDEAKAELVEIVDFLKARRSTRAWVAWCPRGCC
jgi:cell division protease FtsH